MTKKIKRPDGTEETVEGTPDEIAQYERALREQSQQNEGKKKPGVLKGYDGGQSQQEIIRLLEQISRPNPTVGGMPLCNFCLSSPCRCYGRIMWEGTTA